MQIPSFNGLERTVGTPAMAVEGVSFRYDRMQPGRFWTVEQVSFDVGFGEIVGIVGPNGSGKSSLLKLMAGLLRPNTGVIYLDGQPIADRPPRDIARLLALVPQEPAPLFPFSVAETVLMGRFPHRKAGWWNVGAGAEQEADLAAVHRAMEETNVLALADRPISDLSGGERQRVLIARALAQEPRVLLLDEPTAFLDLSHQIEVCTVVRRLAKERRLAIALVTHDLNVASLLCGRVVLVREGTVRAVGTPAEIIKPEILRSVYGCDVVIDRHPETGGPRVTLSMRAV